MQNNATIVWLMTFLFLTMSRQDICGFVQLYDARIRLQGVTDNPYIQGYKLHYHATHLMSCEHKKKRR